MRRLGLIVFALALFLFSVNARAYDVYTGLNLNNVQNCVMLSNVFSYCYWEALKPDRSCYLIANDFYKFLNSILHSPETSKANADVCFKICTSTKYDPLKGLKLLSNIGVKCITKNAF